MIGFMRADYTREKAVGARAVSGYKTRVSRLDQLLGRCQNLEREVRFHRGEVSYSLERMRRLASRLGSPHLRVPCVHVTGTNGKGSTCTYLAAVARAHGLRDGLYTSPHLFTPCERIAMGGEPVA